MKRLPAIKDALIIWLAATWALWFLFEGLGAENYEPNPEIAFLEAAVAIVLTVAALIWLKRDLWNLRKR